MFVFNTHIFYNRLCHDRRIKIKSVILAAVDTVRSHVRPECGKDENKTKSGELIILPSAVSSVSLVETLSCSSSSRIELMWIVTLLLFFIVAQNVEIAGFHKCVYCSSEGEEIWSQGIMRCDLILLLIIVFFCLMNTEPLWSRHVENKFWCESVLPVCTLLNMWQILECFMLMLLKCY